jgi:hypothetical protein
MLLERRGEGYLWEEGEEDAIGKEGRRMLFEREGSCSWLRGKEAAVGKEDDIGKEGRRMPFGRGDAPVG